MRLVLEMEAVDATVCHFTLTCGHKVIAAGTSAENIIRAMNEKRPIKCWKCSAESRLP